MLVYGRYMSYTIKQLAKLAETSVRTLHHYDQIGLLTPSRRSSNKYRAYEEAELLKLQQIMFFRELEFPLSDIKTILDNPNFDMTAALRDQKKMLELKKKRLDVLVETINKTIKKITKQKNMKDGELYDGLSKEESESYAKEAKERWGNTEAYKQSQERYGKMSDADKAKVKKAGEDLTAEIAQNMNKGAKSPEVQALIDRHYNSLRTFYEPNLTMYRGLGNMYADDARFAKYYDRFAPGLAVFMRDAIIEYCDNQE